MSTTETRVPPHDILTEEILLGCLLNYPDNIDPIRSTLLPEDFYKPGHQHIWKTMLDLYETGERPDALTVQAQLANNQLVERDYTAFLSRQFWSEGYSSQLTKKHASIVVEMSRRRRLLWLLTQATEAVFEHVTADAALQEIDLKSDYLVSRDGVEVAGLMSLNEFLLGAQLQETQGKWLIPHILRERWRVMIVAGEGVGKGTLMRWLGLNAAAGRDAFNSGRILLPRKVLYVDCENPVDAIVHQVKISNTEIDLALESDGFYDIWHREGGINLRNRQDRARFEQVLQKSRPEIVFIGPLYKIFRRQAREDLEQVAIEVIEVLDDFRTRYNFALVVEHHAPKGDSKGYRELVPFGSSAWQRWPDFGITLEVMGNPMPGETHLQLEVGRFRPDRLPADWPAELERGGDFKAAFKGHFKGGRNRNNWPWGDEIEELVRG